MAAIDRAPFNALIDDDGSNTKGTKWNKAQIQSVLLDPIDAAIASSIASAGAGYQGAPLFSRFGARSTTSGVIDSFVPMPALLYSSAVRINIELTQLSAGGTNLYLTASGIGVIVTLHDLLPGNAIAVWSSSIFDILLRTAGQNSSTLVTQVFGGGISAPGTVAPLGHVTASAALTGLNWLAGGWTLGLEGGQNAGASQQWAWQATRIG